ncbi:uncharacterized protein PHALS_14829 [Plasmopara halstedii]|uniref:Uncharacterized protein n=1 Tax=Plasmopara halstedii TaxID=4781 RepID=A0A0P1AVQ6_PLAHL|nr:uncharacterized protein PHALS_14829 [Plasmopara halstedii]CEG45623.1 hypothetical protein PHALS_14829 [Plasmopara halstedii]|eukprot:XP_024581992.1 hypothetical protein PHALS_14829 [Plasmopara halstedii]
MYMSDKLHQEPYRCYDNCRSRRRQERKRLFDGLFVAANVVIDKWLRCLTFIYCTSNTPSSSIQLNCFSYRRNHRGYNVKTTSSWHLSQSSARCATSTSAFSVILNHCQRPPPTEFAGITRARKDGETTLKC